MKIVNLDAYTTNPGDLSWDGIKKLGDFTQYDRTAPEQIIERAKGANALIINKTILTREILEKLKPELEYIGLQSTGYNVVDCDAAKELGITVCNIPSYSTNAVAQLVFAFILQIKIKIIFIQKLFLMVNGAPVLIFAFGKRRLVNLRVKQSA